jgi:predicted RND superfamily exporter protein
MMGIAEEVDQEATAAWNRVADEILYLDPEGLTLDELLGAVRSLDDVEPAVVSTLAVRLRGTGAADLSGGALLDRGLEVCEEFTRLSFQEFVLQMEAEVTAPLFKRPDMLRYVKELQEHLHGMSVVGKTSSAVDALEKASYELQYVAPPADASDAENERFAEMNRAHFSVPDSAAATGQVFTQLEGMKKKDSLFHLVTRDYQQANLWVQLKSGDNRDMETVVQSVDEFFETNPPPVEVQKGWAGLTYINVVWQDKMVWGMLSALGSSAVVVFVMMLVLFRSPLFGLLSMIPLSVTIAFIYGLIGLVGKDYDMPVAVLSSLTLGLSVDFAIHFLERARGIYRELGDWRAASRQMFKEPAMAISRNAITISVGFTPLLLAPLVPYRTVGFFLATIMAVSWLATLFILPALITMLQRFVFQSAQKSCDYNELPAMDPEEESPAESTEKR